MSSLPLQKELEFLLATKNPVSLLFSIVRLREMVEETGDALMNGIESAYFENTAEAFSWLIDAYQDTGFYKIMYRYYEGNGYLSEQKKFLDIYFTESYWRDSDFFFYVLSLDPIFSIKFDILRDFLDADTSHLYEKSTDKWSWIREVFRNSPHSKEISDEEIFHIQAFLDTLLPEIQARMTRWNIPLSWKKGGRYIARDLYLEMIADRKGERLEFWKTNVIQDTLHDRLIEELTSSQIFECFSYFRVRILSTPKYNLSLSGDSEYQILLRRAKTAYHGTTDDKLDFIADTHEAMGTYATKREQFQKVFRKGLLYDTSPDLLDSILGVGFLSRAAYHEIKRRARTISQDFPELKEVGRLAATLESSIILRFIRPFLIARLARVFNKNSDLYYFIKFILTIHSSSGYHEYKMLSRFFLSLEAFGKEGIGGVFLRAIQFGWIYIAVVILFYIAPLGVGLSVLALLWLTKIRRIGERLFPRVYLSSNFQMGSYIAVFGVISLMLGLSLALSDNTRIIYQNFRTTINAISLIGNVSIGEISKDISFKASSVEGEGSHTPSRLREVNYLYDIKYFK